MNPTRLKFSGRRAFSMTLLISTLCLSALPKVQAKPPPIATKPFNAAANAPIRAQNYNFQRPAGKASLGQQQLARPFNSAAKTPVRAQNYNFQRAAGKARAGRQQLAHQFNSAAKTPIRARNYSFQRPAGKKTNAGSLRLTQHFNSSAGALPKTKIFHRPAGKSNIGRQSIQQPFNDAAKVPIKPRNYKFQQPAEQQKPIKSLTKVFERARTFSQ